MLSSPRERGVKSLTSSPRAAIPPEYQHLDNELRSKRIAPIAAPNARKMSPRRDAAPRHGDEHETKNLSLDTYSPYGVFVGNLPVNASQQIIDIPAPRPPSAPSAQWELRTRTRPLDILELPQRQKEELFEAAMRRNASASQLTNSHSHMSLGHSRSHSSVPNDDGVPAVAGSAASVEPENVAGADAVASTGTTDVADTVSGAAAGALGDRPQDDAANGNDGNTDADACDGASDQCRGEDERKSRQSQDDQEPEQSANIREPRESSTTRSGDSHEHDLKRAASDSRADSGPQPEQLDSTEGAEPEPSAPSRGGKKGCCVIA